MARYANSFKSRANVSSWCLVSGSAVVVFVVDAMVELNMVENATFPKNSQFQTHLSQPNQAQSQKLLIGLVNNRLLFTILSFLWQHCVGCQEINGFKDRQNRCIFSSWLENV